MSESSTQSAHWPILLLATILMPTAISAAELTLPDGFTAQVFHEGVGARAPVEVVGRLEAEVQEDHLPVRELHGVLAVDADLLLGAPERELDASIAHVVRSSEGIPLGIRWPCPGRSAVLVARAMS